VKTQAISAITISRQMGSGGDELASEVAQRLDWQLVDRGLINQAALNASVPEVALALLDEFGLLNLHPSAHKWQAYQNEVERIIRDQASQGNVIIVGRGSQMVLRNRLDVLRLRLVAPLEKRIARLQQKEGVAEEAARARLETSDRSRARYLQRSYGVDLNDSTLYHLVINLGQLELPRAIDLVIYTLQA